MPKQKWWSNKQANKKYVRKKMAYVIGRKTYLLYDAFD